MRIGIDARFYGGAAAGLSRYTQELIKHIAQAKTPHTYVLFLRKQDAAEFTLQHPRIEVRTTTVPWYSFREQLSFTRELNAADLDLMHFTNFNFPLSYKRPFIISINDLTLLTHAGRGRLSGLKTPAMRLVMRRGAARSQKILTYSEYQKSLIVKNFGVPPEKVEVIYLAVDEQFKILPEKEITSFRKRHGLTEPFVMYTGQWRQHKNLVRLIKAMARLQQPTKLVMVGKVDSAFPVIPKTVRELKLEDRVIFTDFVPDSDLPQYYNAADIFAFPPLSEGFGLPPLEAMACGTTVAASSAPPMPEILGDAAKFFDPYDIDDIARVLQELLDDPKKREKRRSKGLAQVKKYSWKHTAQQTLDVYESALGA